MGMSWRDYSETLQKRNMFKRYRLRAATGFAGRRNTARYGKNDSASHAEMSQGNAISCCHVALLLRKGSGNQLSRNGGFEEVRMQSTVEWNTISSTHRQMNFN
jgi:hypothetical protein